MKYFLISSLLIILMAGTALSVLASEQLTVFVSIAPQKYFVERITGKHVIIQVMVSPGQSPATYDPSPRQMATLSEASLFFRIGVPYENSLIPKLKNTYSNLKIIDTRRGIKLRTFHNRASTTDAHHDHHHASAQDPHTWLDPRLVKIQAGTIFDALCEIDPGRKDIYRKNLDTFIMDLDSIHNEISQVLLPFKGKYFMVFHPSYGYFADTFGLKQIAVERDGKNPSAKQIARWIDLAGKEDIHIVFVQPQFSSAIAKTLAKSIDGKVVRLDPLSLDYFSNLRYMANEIKTALTVVDSQ